MSWRGYCINRCIKCLTDNRITSNLLSGAIVLLGLSGCLEDHVHRLPLAATIQAMDLTVSGVCFPEAWEETGVESINEPVADANREGMGGNEWTSGIHHALVICVHVASDGSARAVMIQLADVFYRGVRLV